MNNKTVAVPEEWLIGLYENAKRTEKDHTWIEILLGYITSIEVLVDIDNKMFE